MSNTAIEIQINARNKSIRMGELLFPRFVVLSGKNGSGKTHLLETLANANITSIAKANGEACVRRKLVNAAEMRPAQSDLNEGNARYSYKLYAMAKSNRSMTRPSLQPPLETILTGQLRRKVNQIMKYTGKGLDELTEEDFLLHSPVDDASSEADPFSQNVEAIFNRYADKKLENELKELDEQKGRGDGSYLTPDKFIEKYGNPMEEFNSLLRAAKFGYCFNQPDELRAHNRIWNRQQDFQLKLIDELNGNEVELKDLSTGEKVILSLVFAIYNSHKDYYFPDVLLLDEPDAYLHPSMIRQFIDVVTEVFVDRGASVIMTTHSPTTVALSHEESLYVMDRRNRWPQKISMPGLINELLEGVPSIRVDYENRRQVFVESKNDVYYYERFYDSVKDKLEPEKALHFISSGTKGSGDCKQVKEIVSKLRGFRNKTVFGIVDWDGVNVDADGVFVLGNRTRDNIESYIFDPLLVGVFLLREKLCLAEDLGLNRKTTYIDVPTLRKTDLQKVVDSVISKVRANIGAQPSVAGELRYVGGCRLRAQQWYLTTDGHELQTAVCSSFPRLKAYRNLPGEMIKKVLSDIPDFVPMDLLELFQRIQDDRIAVEK